MIVSMGEGKFVESDFVKNQMTHETETKKVS
jgi:hypothetical protein